MASVRYLKKEVDYLAGAVIADCMNYAIYSGKHDDEVAKLVEDMVSARNELHARILDGKGCPKSERKAYYNAIISDMIAKVDDSFTKLSELVKK